MTVAELAPVDQADPAWEELIASSPEANIFHHPAWGQVLTDAYGYRPIALADPDVSAGALMARVRRPHGRAWVSLPFSDHCPALSRDGSLGQLAAGLAAWSRREGTPVELRGSLPAAREWSDVPIGWRHVLTLADAESLRTRLSRTHRRWLRQAERTGLRVRFGRSEDDVADFYRLHVATRRRHGVPVQPRRFFDAFWRRLILPGLGAVALIAPPGGRPVAGAVVLAWRGTAISKYEASDPASWGLRPNHLLYWAVIRWTLEAGCTRLDFGRTEARHAGLVRWKSGWGAEAIPLSYSLTGARRVGALGPSRLDTALSQVIRRSPAFVCRGLGALLYRYAA